ncbi:hypothetical protein ACTMTU_25525 [Streptomyces sp. OZ13]|uniref:hypothetical protein n=1 Tax=Streptomyces sp. OZ13 TaxID=3452210 RepID=UPI003F8C98FE
MSPPLMGLGLILWITGLIGIAKAVSHYRWALRLVTRHPPRRRSGAARTAERAGPGTYGRPQR